MKKPERHASKSLTSSLDCVRSNPVCRLGSAFITGVIIAESTAAKMHSCGKLEHASWVALAAHSLGCRDDPEEYVGEAAAEDLREFGGLCS